MKRLRSLTLLLVLMALVAACSGSGDDTATTAASEPSTAEITIADFTFSGPDGPIPVGTTVTVTNEAGITHTWTADDGTFDETLDPGTSTEFTFDEAGEYEFFCNIHPQMEGSITVEG